MSAQFVFTLILAAIFYLTIDVIIAPEITDILCAELIKCSD